MPNHYDMRKYFLILALALFSTGAFAQSYIVMDKTDSDGVRLVKTTSVTISNNAGQFDVSFIGAKLDFFKTYAIIIESKKGEKAWYVDKGSYLAVDIAEKTVYAKANKDVRPKVVYDKDAKKPYYEFMAEFEIPYENGSDLLDEINSLSFQLRDSNNLKQQFKLDIPQETSKEMAEIFFELMKTILL